MSLFEDTFKCSALNVDGKKFDRVDRIVGISENYKINLICDIASHIYRIAVGDRFQLTLASTLNLDGTPDTNEYIAHRQQASLMDRYDYVMHGKVFKVSAPSSSAASGVHDTRIEVFVSFGGLLMSLKGDVRNLAKLDLDMRLYLLIRLIK